jgi:hypothetical protein
MTNPEKIFWWVINHIPQFSWEVQKTIKKTNNISNAIVKASSMPKPKILTSWPYIHWESNNKIIAEDLVWDDAIIQFSLPDNYHFMDGTNSKVLNFKVKSPWTIEKINLDIINEEGTTVNKIDYQLVWAA